MRLERQLLATCIALCTPACGTTALHTALRTASSKKAPQALEVHASDALGHPADEHAALNRVPAEDSVSKQATTPPPATRPEPTLLACEEYQVTLMNTQGQTLRVLANMEALAVRQMPVGGYVLLSADMSLYRVPTSKAEGTPPAAELVAKLPAALDWDTHSLHMGEADVELQMDNDFVVDKGGERVCLTLSDRNINMMEVQVVHRVMLRSGQVQTQVWWVNDEDPPTASLADCKAAPPAAVSYSTPSTSTFSVDYNKDKGEFGTWHLKSTSAESLAPTEEERSRDGRFVLMSVPAGEEDYIYRQLYVLDRSKGNVLLLGEHMVAVATAADVEQLANATSREVEIAQRPSVVVESEANVEFLNAQVLRVRDTLYHLPDGPVLGPLPLCL